MVVRLAGVYERQLKIQVSKTDFNNDELYFEEIDRILDDLFELAEDRGLEWKDIARLSGLSIQTVINLGERWTKRPQYRTVILIAWALDRQVELVSIPNKSAKPVLRLKKAS